MWHLSLLMIAMIRIVLIFLSYLENLEAPEPTGILSSSALKFSKRRPYLCQIGR